MAPPEIIAVAWTTRIVIPISIIIPLRLIYKEFKQTTSKSSANKYETWLNRTSLWATTFFTLQLFIWFLHKIPVICLYSYRLIVVFYFLAVGSFLFYQGIRLQYCLSSSRVHSHFGYSNYTFLAVYTINMIFCLYAIGTTWMIFEIYDYGVYGCEFKLNNTTFPIFVPVLAIGSFLNVYILALYAVKLCQVRNRFRGKSDDRDTAEIMNHAVVIQRVNDILTKIVLIQMLIYLVAIFGILAVFVAVSSDFNYSGVFVIVIATFMVIFTMYMFYFMNERNDEEYRIFLQRLKITACIAACCLSQDEQSDISKITSISVVENNDEMELDKKRSLPNTTNFETRTNSIGDKGMGVTGMELSTMTVTKMGTNVSFESHFAV